jgi:hypothetical protein
MLTYLFFCALPIKLVARIQWQMKNDKWKTALSLSQLRTVLDTGLALCHNSLQSKAPKVREEKV